MRNFWGEYQDSLGDALRGLHVSSRNGQRHEPGDALGVLCAWAVEVCDRDGTMILVGNGGSAAFASHMAVDWTKAAGVRAMACNDMAFLTAIGNDCGYDRVFADPVGWYGRPGDLLVTVSSSGNSPNIVAAIARGRERGMRVVTFSGMAPDNQSRQAGDLNFYIPVRAYGLIECSHQVLLHAWLDRYIEVRGQRHRDE